MTDNTKALFIQMKADLDDMGLNRPPERVAAPSELRDALQAALQAAWESEWKAKATRVAIEAVLAELDKCHNQ